MAVAFVSQNAANVVSAAAATTLALTITAPATIVAGNALVAVVYQANNTCGLVTATGWTLGGQSTVVTSTGATTGGAGLMTVLSKVATGSEPGSYVFTTTHTGTSQVSYLAGGVLQYSGTDPAAALGGTPAFTVSGTAVTSINAPSVTAAAATVEVVGYGSFSGNAFATPSGTTARASSQNAGNVSIYLDDKSVAAGATGTTAGTAASGPAVAGSLLLSVAAAANLLPDLHMAPRR